MTKKVPAIEVKNTELDKPVFIIENNGNVFWLKGGKMIQVKVDKELAQAFAAAVIKISGVKWDVLIDEIRKGH